MAILRFKDIMKLSKADRLSRLNEFKLALVKGSVTANKAASKSRELKRTIARINTAQKLAKAEVEKK